MDGIGFLFVNKKAYFKRLLNGIFILRHFIKKDKKFKEEWDKKQETLPLEYKFIWRASNLPEGPLSQIIKFFSI